VVVALVVMCAEYAIVVASAVLPTLATLVASTGWLAGLVQPRCPPASLRQRRMS
jgi:hypothetical protein